VQRLSAEVFRIRFLALAPALPARADELIERHGGIRPRLFLWFGQKMHQALTLLATIENNHPGMKTLAVISILALLTISGAAYTDQILTSDQQTAQRVD
jgi:hypothetical protein